MDALLHRSKAVCPFLNKTSPATLRSLSTATHHSPGPGGGTISNLQFIARRCPVMNKALALQSARIRTSNYTTAAPRVGAVKSMMAKKMHTSADHKARVDTRIYHKDDQGRLKTSVENMPYIRLTVTVQFSRATQIRLVQHPEMRSSPAPSHRPRRSQSSTTKASITMN
jgi:hypothetical protein